MHIVFVRFQPLHSSSNIDSTEKQIIAASLLTDFIINFTSDTAHIISTIANTCTQFVVFIDENLGYGVAVRNPVNKFYSRH